MPDEMRTPGKRSETIHPCRTSPDPSDSQIHAETLSSSVRIVVRGLEWPWQNLNFVLSDPFLY